jgi:hypothetical protein
MAALHKTLALNPLYYLLSRPHEAADASIEVVDEPQAGERYTLLLDAIDQRGLNQPHRSLWPQELAAAYAAMPKQDDDPILDHLRSNPVFWLLHEPAVLREEGYMIAGDTPWHVESEEGRAMHALIYEIRALECRLIGHGEPVERQRRIYDRVTVELTRSVPLMEFPAVFPRQTSSTVPRLDAAAIETERVGDLVLATNAQADGDGFSTWALLLDRGNHALALLSGDEGTRRDERFRYLWNLECPRVSEMVAAAQARLD